MKWIRAFLISVASLLGLVLITMMIFRFVDPVQDWLLVGLGESKFQKFEFKDAQLTFSHFTIHDARIVGEGYTASIDRIEGDWRFWAVIFDGTQNIGDFIVQNAVIRLTRPFFPVKPTTAGKPNKGLEGKWNSVADFDGLFEKNEGLGDGILMDSLEINGRIFFTGHRSGEFELRSGPLRPESTGTIDYRFTLQEKEPSSQPGQAVARTGIAGLRAATVLGQIQLEQGREGIRGMVLTSNWSMTTFNGDQAELYSQMEVHLENETEVYTATVRLPDSGNTNPLLRLEARMSEEGNLEGSYQLESRDDASTSQGSPYGFPSLVGISEGSFSLQTPDQRWNFAGRLNGELHNLGRLTEAIPETESLNLNIVVEATWEPDQVLSLKQLSGELLLSEEDVVEIELTSPVEFALDKDWIANDMANRELLILRVEDISTEVLNTSLPGVQFTNGTLSATAVVAIEEERFRIEFPDGAKLVNTDLNLKGSTILEQTDFQVERKIWYGPEGLQLQELTLQARSPEQAPNFTLTLMQPVVLSIGQLFHGKMDIPGDLPKGDLLRIEMRGLEAPWLSDLIPYLQLEGGTLTGALLISFSGDEFDITIPDPVEFRKLKIVSIAGIPIPDAENGSLLGKISLIDRGVRIQKMTLNTEIQNKANSGKSASVSLKLLKTMEINLESIMESEWNRLFPKGDILEIQIRNFAPEILTQNIPNLNASGEPVNGRFILSNPGGPDPVVLRMPNPIQFSKIQLRTDGKLPIIKDASAQLRIDLDLQGGRLYINTFEFEIDRMLGKPMIDIRVPKDIRIPVALSRGKFAAENLPEGLLLEAKIHGLPVGWLGNYLPAKFGEPESLTGHLVVQNKPEGLNVSTPEDFVVKGLRLSSKKVLELDSGLMGGRFEIDFPGGPEVVVREMKISAQIAGTTIAEIEALKSLRFEPTMLWNGKPGWDDSLPSGKLLKISSNVGASEWLGQLLQILGIQSDSLEGHWVVVNDHRPGLQLNQETAATSVSP